MIEPAYPYPPRFWWLRRIAAICVLIVAALAATDWVRDYFAQKNLQAVIASLHAAGEKILPEDFDAPAISPDVNAADYLNRAAGAVSHVAEPPGEGNVAYPNHLPMPIDWYSIAQKAVQADQSALQLARQAREQSQVDWSLRFRTPAIGFRLPMLSQQRELANVLADSALYEHLIGNDFEAMEIIRDLLAQADAMDRQPLLIGHFVALGLDSLAFSHLHLIAPGLQLTDDPARPIAPLIPARQQQVREIIAILIRPTDHDLINAIQGERMLQLDMLIWGTHSSLLRALYLRDVPEVMNINQRLIIASTQPTDTAAMRIAAPFSPGIITPGQLSYSQFPSYDRLLQGEYRCRAQRRMMAVDLAVRLYRIDHQGRWPAKLDDLVPQYLPAVPIDPTSNGAAPLGYFLADHGNRPLLHMAGERGIDIKLNESAVPAGPQDGWDGTIRDQWLDLSNFSPTPSTQPS